MLWNWFGFARGDRGRNIFAYRDGTRKRSADPVAVEAAFVKELGDDWRACVRRLDRPDGRHGLVGEQADAADADWEANRRKVLAAVDAAFGVHPYTDHGGEQAPTGLTEVERLGLLAGFLHFCADLIEAARPFPAARSRASPSTAAPRPSNQPA